MSSKQRPLSPFMLGPYYRLQMTSVMSFAHRASGVYLSLVGLPLLLWWLAALGMGPDSYETMKTCTGSLLGRLAVSVSVFCLFYHLCNGIRHLVWDTGRAMSIEAAYRAGWAVIVAATVLTAIVLGGVL